MEKASLGNLKTVGNYLKELENHGFFKSEQVVKEKLYLKFRLLELLRMMLSAYKFYIAYRRRYVD